MLSYFVLVSAAAILTASVADEDIDIPTDKAGCVRQMVQWCNNTQYPQESVGIAMMSIVYEDPKGKYRVFCAADSEGTNCTREGKPWFSCSPDNKMTYKSKPLTEDSTDVDDDICKTADTAFNDIMIDTLTPGGDTDMKDEMFKNMEGFFQELASMQEQIDTMQNMMQNLFSPTLMLNNIYEGSYSANATTLSPMTPDSS